MSSSAISAAKRRTEIALKNYNIPTTSDRIEPQDALNDQVLLSLLQSRINWSTNVFIKYRPDPDQQPKRSNVIRRRYPMMRELGQATLELGPHLFYETSFYEAIRSDSWVALGKKAGLDGLDVYEPKSFDNTLASPKIEEATEANNSMDGQQQQQQQQQQMDGNGNDKSDLTDNMAMQTDSNTVTPISQTTHGTDNQTTTIQSSFNTTDITQPDTNDMITQNATSGSFSSAQNVKEPIDHLIYKDIVIEFKDQPSERYLFPKDVIMQVLEDSTTAKCSFMLPLDRTAADCFFWDAKKKLQHFGGQSSIPEIKAMATTSTNTDSATTATTDDQKYQPVNIRLLGASIPILDALRSTIHNADQVRTKMINQMQKVPDRSYLDYSLSKSERQALHDLIHRVHTQPDIISGPIAAEKKRNEIGLAIKLGKRPETDRHEAEPPKTKQHIPGKEDGFRRCVYCSTRYTVMWRKGPAGEGTLCNGCGILWLQGKILIGAPVITKEEEKQQIKEKWRIMNRQREQEEWNWKQQRIKEEQERAIKEEQEAAHRMELCIKAKKKRALASNHRLDTTRTSELHPSVSPPQPLPQFPLPPPPPFSSTTPLQQMQHPPFEYQPHLMANGHTGAALGMVAAQIAHQQHQNYQTESGSTNTQAMTSNSHASQTQPSHTPSAPISAPAPAPSPSSAAPVAGIQPPPSSTQESTSTQASSSSSSSSSSSYHIFNLPQIPLPTLSIEFSHNTTFSHPHCTVALSHQKQFSIQLTKDDVPIHFHIPREALAAATTFDILGQVDSAGRDILLMSCLPDDIGQGPGVPLEAFGSTLYDPKDPQRRMVIRFLEKIDTLGGPVVKKILECWLAGK